MNLLFLGSGAFGLPTLSALSRTHILRAVVTQPDKPAGRGSALSPTPIGAYAAQTLPQIPLLKPAKINDPAVVSQLRAFNADAWVVIAYGQKLGKSLLDGVFAINLHASLLPRWRGAAPISAAILAGDVETGNSIITLADRMDAGHILARSRTPITPSTTTGELHDILANQGPGLVEQVLAAKLANSLHPEPQDESHVTIAPKLSKSDGRLDFHAPADECRRRIHAFNPWPGITVSFRGQPLKLLTAASDQPSVSSSQPGSILEPAVGLIACGNQTTLKLLTVQPAGKKPMPFPDFARGQRITANEVLTNPTP